jgi:type IV pilus assembly protein PilB
MISEKPQEPLIGRLLSEGWLDPSELELARVERQGREGSMIPTLLDLGFLTAEHLATALAAEAGLELADVGRSTACGPLMQQMGAERMRRLKALPMVDVRGIRFVAMANPMDLPAIDEVRQLVGPEIEIRVITEAALVEAIERISPKQDVVADAIQRCLVKHAFSEESGSRLESVSPGDSKGEGPVVDLVDDLVTKALDIGASDLHFEPAQSSLRVRFRCDGHLGGDVLVPKVVQSGVLARLKILGRLDVSESRIPQDGCGTLSIGWRRVHLRISTLPTQFGESVVLRLHPAGEEALKLEELGLDEHLERDLGVVLKRTHGALVVTGPTGSGKTTTLYAILRELNRPDVSLFTLEDPVEIALPGVRQTQIHEEVGLTFARGLRSLLRQDPDVILVGETRDSETAQLMVRAALTGHSVLTSLHTNDAAGAIPRLLDLGVEPGLLPGSLNAVLAQRLVRQLCIECRRPEDRPKWSSGSELSPSMAEWRSPWHPVGCPSCGNSGYDGRMGLFEFLQVCEGLQELIPTRPSASQVARLARQRGMIPMRQRGEEAIQRGDTTAEEVCRALGDPEA